jgi:XTP/dITP diphosphohydrolase
LDELEAELKRDDKQRSEAELGDFLFAVINAARLYKLNPDNALEQTNQKFIRRFNYIEQHSIKQGKPLTEMTLAEMDALWNEAKREEQQN